MAKERKDMTKDRTQDEDQDQAHPETTQGILRATLPKSMQNVLLTLHKQALEGGKNEKKAKEGAQEEVRKQGQQFAKRNG